jgi:peptide/nickel transport system substrate-binding protein
MKSKFWTVLTLIVVLSMVAVTGCTPKTATQNGVYMTINFEQWGTWVRNFNPFSPDALGSTLTAIYEPMMIYNKSTGELVPWLATEYTWNSDNTLLTFKLREGVKWSDGKPFTANDVIYTFDLLKTNAALMGSATNVLSDFVESYAAADDTTVEFKFNTVYTPALYDIANQFIVPEHVWKDVEDPSTWTNENPIGTGPFTEVTKFEEQIYVLEKNTHYWQAGKPAFQGVRYPAYADNDAANLALASGELDWAGNFVPNIENVYVAKDPENFHYYFVGADTILLYINHNLKPFDDPAVRKAISMGINRQMIVETAMFNYIPPADATGLGDTYAVWKDPAAVAAGTWVKYDAAAANAALDAAGLVMGSDGVRLDREGKKMEYELIVPSGWTDWVSAAQIISQNMTDLGITISLMTPEETTDIDRVEKGDFQWAFLWCDGGPTPYNFYRGQMSSLTVMPVGENSGDNFLRYVNEDVDALLTEFAQTSDLASQKAIIAEIEMIFVDEAPALPLFPGPDWFEYNTAKFTGFPGADDPYAPGVPWPNGPYNTALIVLTTLTPK